MNFSTIASSNRRYKPGVSEPTGYELTIISPTEGEEVTADFAMTWKDNTTQITITNITEGQEVQSDFTMTFKTLL